MYSMNQLNCQDSELYLEQVSLTQIAEQFGTPTYAYSRRALTEAYQQYAEALDGHPGMICYAVKANSNLAVLNVLARAGAGFDIVSIGELERVLAAGGDPKKIIFSGVGKTTEEIQRSLDVGIACFNVESAAELDHVAEVAAACDKVAAVSLRINPDVDANTHPYISTGLKSNKFGIDINIAETLYERARDLPSINPCGIDCHIGSQLSSVEPLLEACDRLLGLYDRLVAKGIEITHLDLGGGIGVTYQDEHEPNVADYISATINRLNGRPLQLLFEPGRSIVANAGVLLTTVQYLKPTEEKNFLVVDAAMNDLLRPALYQAWQNIVPVKSSTHTTGGTATKSGNNSDVKIWDVVGPICESSDFIGKDRELDVQQNDLLAVLSSGAYGFVMSSNYNSRPRAAEVMIDGNTIHLARQRESVIDLFRSESILPK